MLFRRKKKKRGDDDNQLLLFTKEEMEGGEDMLSRSENNPPSDVSDEGLQEKQAPIANIGPPAEVSSVIDETTTKRDNSIRLENTDSPAGMNVEPPASSIPLTDNRYSADHQQLLESMHKAILRLSVLSVNDIRLIAIESATHAQEGINTERTYCLQALKGEILSGYDFIAYYYVSFARSFPTMLNKIDLPFSDIYEEALSLER